MINIFGICTLLLVCAALVCCVDVVVSMLEDINGGSNDSN